MIEVTRSGSNFKHAEARMKRLSNSNIFASLAKYGQIGVDALAAATPRDSGETAASWSYEIRQTRGSWEIIWRNTHINAGQNVAILLQYGHGTGTGGYVQGRDYINPSIKPIFAKILADVRKVVRAG